MNNDEHLRYPIGRFSPKASYTPEEIRGFIDRIREFPSKLEKVSKIITPQQLQTPYRPGGWTIAQVFHHLPDSHMNGYIRTKWTLTESTPTIKAYNEADWANTPEVTNEIQIPLRLLTALHEKWASLVSVLKPEDFQREFFHPESKIHISLGRQVATYAWHGEHHLAHINLVLSK